MRKSQRLRVCVSGVLHGRTSMAGPNIARNWARMARSCALLHSFGADVGHEAATIGFSIMHLRKYHLNPSPRCPSSGDFRADQTSGRPSAITIVCII